MSLQLNGDTGVTFNDASLQGAAASPFGLKNRIINGAMEIDQRNAGAAVTVDGAFPLDRWKIILDGGGALSAQRSTTAPAGYTNSLYITATTADTSLGTSDEYSFRHAIEGFNVADLGWGTANAQTITLSFKVRSSVTGTYGGVLRNNAGNRIYVFSYTINSANTWEDKSVTIAGDTSGTWLTDNGIGIQLIFSLGAGSSRLASAGSWGTTGSIQGVTGQTQWISTLNATFYITGVQLEVGSTATPFERRLYNQELANCQRYYEKSYPASSAVPTGSVVGITISLGTQTYAGGTGANQMLAGMVYFKVLKRASPTVTIYSWTSSTVGAVSTGWTGADLAANTGTIGDATVNGFSIYNSTGSNVTTNGYAILFQFAASAEL